MAQLTFPVTGLELRLPVIVGLDRSTMVARLSAGQAPGPSVWTEAVLDTGSNITCISQPLVQRLGLVPAAQGGSHTVGGQVAASLYEVSLSIPPPQNLPGPLLTRSSLIVMELPLTIPGIDMLIGLDLLLECKLLLDGPGRWFTLEF
jgi:hypothetical protein